MRYVVAGMLLFPRLCAILLVWCRRFYPKIDQVNVNWWWHHYEPITVSWYFYELVRIVEGAAWPLASGVIIAYRIFDKKMFWFVGTFISVRFAGLIGFLFDRNSSLFSEIILYIAFALPLAVLILSCKKQAKIIKL